MFPADFLSPAFDFLVPLDMCEIYDSFLDLWKYLAEFFVLDLALERLLKFIYVWWSFGVFDFFRDLCECIGSNSLSILIETFLLDYWLLGLPWLQTLSFIIFFNSRFSTLSELICFKTWFKNGSLCCSLFGEFFLVGSLVQFDLLNPKLFLLSELLFLWVAWLIRLRLLLNMLWLIIAKSRSYSPFLLVLSK